MALRKSTWNTYSVRCYTYDVANDQRSAGGVHLHQVRRHRGNWQTRIMQSNSAYSSLGPVSSVSDEDGEAYFETAKHA